MAVEEASEPGTWWSPRRWIPEKGILPQTPCNHSSSLVDKKMAERSHRLGEKMFGVSALGAL